MTTQITNDLPFCEVCKKLKTEPSPFCSAYQHPLGIEVWRQDTEHPSIIRTDSKSADDICHCVGEDAETNAARIVACVKFCHGLNNEWLAQISGLTLRNLFLQQNEMIIDNHKQ